MFVGFKSGPVPLLQILTVVLAQPYAPRTEAHQVFAVYKVTLLAYASTSESSVKA